MKRRAAIVMTMFYLLITTGMYVCTVSCGANSVIDFFTFKPSHQNHEHSSEHEGVETDCSEDTECSCCKKHGNYVVKENIKPSANFYLVELPPIIQISTYSDSYLVHPLEVDVRLWPKSNAPPPGISTPIFIKIRSLLI